MRLAIVAGHAIYRNRQWHGGFPGEDSFYARHVAAGIGLLKHTCDLVCLSGAPTRPLLEHETQGVSEAEGMHEFAIDSALITPTDERVIEDRFARDSFENLFYSLLAARMVTGEWASEVTVVTWSSKGLRYHLMAAGLGLGGRIRFHGVGDYPTQADLERACAAEARFVSHMADVSYEPPAYKLVDPLLRDEREFAVKRRSRMPSRFTADMQGENEYITAVKAAYAPMDATIATLIDQVHRLKPGDAWRHVQWPRL